MMMMRNNGSQQKMADTAELEVKLFERSHQNYRGFHKKGTLSYLGAQG